MSNKLQSKLQNALSEEKKYILDVGEFNFMNSIDQIRRSFEFHMKRVQSEYIKMIATNRFGYDPEVNLEFNIDLADPHRELTIKIADLTKEQLPEQK